ncbi:serine/threonine-protein kinase [Kitasatospora sp. NPDC096077]|uniref:serine/threonine-protein kinase n=1 Tax=Kitasatospora sp. NPDC096077 TaxID=3155544 RepID=UPI003326D777
MDSGGPGLQLIDGRFELVERLGGGGMGLVWRARDTVLQREVALKEVRAPDPAYLAGDPGAAAVLRERVLREARSLARLNHPHVATIHHIVDRPEYPHPWLVMELVTGGSLHDRLARGPMSPLEAARLGRGVLSALSAAHAAGIQHRDVKPGNVLLRPDGSPVLTDFGIAALAESPSLTTTGALIGSPEYIAPERVRGEEGNPASDLWSLGMMLFVAVEGYHPLRRGTSLATLAAVLDEPVPPPVRSGPLGPVLAALLVRDTAARPDAWLLDRQLAEAEYAASVVGEAGTVGTVRFQPTAGTVPPQATERVTGYSGGYPGGYPTGATTGHPTGYPGGHPTGHPAGATTGQTFGPPRPPAQEPSDARPHPGRKRGRLRSGYLLLVPVLTMSVVYGIQYFAAKDAGKLPGSDAPAPYPGLLTPAGVRGAIQSMNQKAGGRPVLEFTLQQDSGGVVVATAANPKLYDSFDYRDGKTTQGLRSGTVAFEEKPVDLQAVNWDALPALLQRADAELGIAHPTSHHIAVRNAPGMGDTGPTLLVYVGDSYGSGYLRADANGTVTKTYPRS